MTFARRVFLIAGIYGLIVIAPQLFLEAQTSSEVPPAITHPEFYYGFVLVAIAWQVAFLTIARDPARFRPLMIAAMLEKAGFGIAVPVLWHQGRVPGFLVAFAAIDLVLGALFFVSWMKTWTANTGPRRRYRMEEQPSRGGQTDVLLLDLGRAYDRAGTTRLR
jgi:hypothetical protein